MVYAAVTVTALFWGANFILAPVVVDAMPPLAAAAARFIIAALVMVALASWRGEAVAPALRRHGVAYGALGVVGIAGFNVLFFFGMGLTSPINGALIMATNPLLTALVAGLVLGERLGPRHLLALPLALGGVVLVVLGGGRSAQDFNAGDLMLIVGNLCWAAYNVMGRRLMPTGSALTNTAAVMITGAATLTLAAVIHGDGLGAPTPGSLAALLVMAVTGTALAYLFWNIGIARLGAGRTALFLNLVPVFTILGSTLAGAPPSLAQAGGGVMVVAAVLASMVQAPRPAVVLAEAQSGNRLRSCS